MPPSRIAKALLALALIAGCAATEQDPPPAGVADPLAALPATFSNTPSCDGCLAITLTLRPDGAYLVREKLGASEFYDFGRWRALPGGMLEATGGRDGSRRYRAEPPDTLLAWAGTQGGDLKRAPKVEVLRGPFRLLGLFDGKLFRECASGVSWPLAETRAAAALADEVRRRDAGALLVAIDAAFQAQQDGREALLVQRTASVLNERACPG